MTGVVVNRPVKLCIFSTPAHLPVVRAAADRMCRLIGFDEDSAHRVVLSIDEAMTNVIRHAYDGAEDRPIEVELTAVGHSRPEALRVRIRDYGRRVDSSQIKSRELSDVRPGGLGVHIMNECMDRVEYEPAEGGGTTLTMFKHLPAGEGGQEA